MNSEKAIMGGTRMNRAPGTKTVAELAADTIWIYEQWKTLCITHAQKAIGVDGGKIVAVADSFGDLNAKLKEMGLRPAEVANAYIHTHPDYLKNFLPQIEGRIEALRNGDVSP